MYLQVNLMILVTFWCPICHPFNQCVYEKLDSTIWDYPFQFCEGGFWIWIRGIVGVYDDNISLGYINPILGIYIFL
jgi:hypothetical protein